MRITIRLSWLNLLLLAALAQSAEAATVERFSPQGEIRSVRQVAARFSEDMVKFGDPQAPTPFAVDCAEAGQGRWLDARSWVFDFSRDLTPVVRCAFKLKPEVKALAGAALTGKSEFAFSTGGQARADFFKALKREKESNDAKLLLLKCQQRLPPGAKLTRPARPTNRCSWCFLHL